jgi:hypothetical protein
VPAKKALAGVSAQTPQEVSVQAKPAQVARLPVPSVSSLRFAEFQHVAYAIGYPDNWRVNGSPDADVTIYPEGGLAGGSLAYGAMISGFQPKSKTNELHDALHELSADMKLSNPSLRLFNSPQKFTVRGRTVLKLDWLGTSAVHEKGKPLSERVRLVLLPGRAGIVLYCVFVAPDADFNGLWSVYERMLNSMQVR